MPDKCHQRVIREQHEDGHAVPADFSTASVREIPYDQAKEFILKYEWLGNMGITVRAFGLFFGDELAAVECFGHPGSDEITNVCGEEHADKTYWLARGACAHWAHPHSSSYLITESCKLMGAPWKTRDGKDMDAKFVFCATADTDAGEIGQCYQACNWIYVGLTTSDRMFNKPGLPPERAKSYRVLVKGPIRNRSNRVEQPDPDGRRYFVLDGQKYYKGDTTPDGQYIGGSEQWPLRWNVKYGNSAKEAEKARLAEILADGWIEVKGNPKHMYVGIYGDKRMRRVLREALNVEYMPKRKGIVCSACGAPVKYGKDDESSEEKKKYSHKKEAPCKARIEPKIPYPKRGSVDGDTAGTTSDSEVQPLSPAPLYESAGLH